MPVGPWLPDLPPPAPPLDGDSAADVVVVGAGYAGLSAALALRARGREVVVLEREHAGFGASGRNAGHLTPVIGKDLPTLARLFSRARARQLVAVAEDAVAHVEAAIADLRIDCDYEPVGNLLAAVHPAQHHVVDAAARAGEALGVDGELLDDSALRRRGVPPAFTRAYRLRRGGILDPGRYLLGLRRAALAAGVRLHEGTAVDRIEDGSPASVRTPRGTVRARRVVVTVNAWLAELGLLRQTVLPIEVSLFRTAPLTAAQKAAVGWPGREGVYTAHEILESYRLTADDRIVGGSKTVRYALDGRILGDDAATDRLVEQAFRDRFPQLQELEITDRWSGPLSFALDFLPALGRRGALCWAAGCAGHGLAVMSLAGTALAAMACDDPAPPARVLWDHWKPPLPPEPLRWLAITGLVGLLRALDRRVDRQAAAAPAAPPLVTRG